MEPVQQHVLAGLTVSSGFRYVSSLALQLSWTLRQMNSLCVARAWPVGEVQKMELHRSFCSSKPVGQLHLTLMWRRWVRVHALDRVQLKSQELGNTTNMAATINAMDHHWRTAPFIGRQRGREL
jgi:hypothetical protein